MNKQEFQKQFAVGQIVNSGGPRSRLLIKTISETYVSVVPVNGVHKIPMRLYFDQLTAVVNGFVQINPKNMSSSIQPVLVAAGLKKEHTTENYLYGFAREYLKREQSRESKIYPDEIAVLVPEGALKRVTVNAYERNVEARLLCIAHWKPRCVVCEMTFEERYGIGSDFIHVHHLKPLSEIRKEYKVDPINDLVPVCPNCHAMLHSENPPLKPEELKQMLREQCSSIAVESGTRSLLQNIES